MPAEHTDKHAGVYLTGEAIPGAPTVHFSRIYASLPRPEVVEGSGLKHSESFGRVAHNFTQNKTK